MLFVEDPKGSDVVNINDNFINPSNKQDKFFDKILIWWWWRWAKLSNANEITEYNSYYNIIFDTVSFNKIV